MRLPCVLEGQVSATVRGQPHYSGEGPLTRIVQTPETNTRYTIAIATTTVVLMIPSAYESGSAILATVLDPRGGTGVRKGYGE